MNKKEIIRELIVNYKQFADEEKALDDSLFALSKNGKWSPGQQLDHVIKCVEPINMALALPKFIIRLVGGSASQPSRSYEQLVGAYKELLAKGGKSPAKYEPIDIAADRKTGLVYQLEQMTMSMCESIEGFSEEQLDKLRLPHPLLGKITIREMLYFTIYHVQHHRDQMLRNL